MYQSANMMPSTSTGPYQIRNQEPLTTSADDIYQTVPGMPTAAVPLAQAASASRYQGKDNREYSAATSYVSNVVPTGLFTSYIPAAQFQGVATQAPAVDNEDLSKIHDGRTAELRQRSAGVTTLKYTDDLYPPYYAKAKKIRSTRRGKPGCCQ